jgi:Protein of unknown function (DUF3592)
MTNQVTSLICFAVGGVSAAFFFWSLLRQNAIRRWSFTQGKVLESRLNITSGDSFEPYVRYSYAVQGKSFTNDKISPVNYLTEDENAAKKAIAPYWIGSAVNVYYDPNDPSRSVLEPRNSFWIHLFWAGFAAFFIAMGFVSLFHKD